MGLLIKGIDLKSVKRFLFILDNKSFNLRSIIFWELAITEFPSKRHKLYLNLCYYNITQPKLISYLKEICK